MRYAVHHEPALLMGLGKHLVVFGALLANLWLGGELVEAWLGHYARGGFELLLILAYMVFVLGMRFPLRRPQRGP